MTAQLDLFTTYDGPGFYTVRCEHATGGIGHCRWYDSELHAQAQMQAMIDHAKARGDRKVTGVVELHDGPPLYARWLDGVWRAAARGLSIITDGHRYMLDGKHVHPDQFLHSREAAAS